MSKTLSSVLVARRKEMKLTQGELAKQLGISQSLLSAWENDIALPSEERLVKIADTIGIDSKKLQALSIGNSVRKLVMDPAYSILHICTAVAGTNVQSLTVADLSRIIDIEQEIGSPLTAEQIGTMLLLG